MAKNKYLVTSVQCLKLSRDVCVPGQLQFIDFQISADFHVVVVARYLLTVKQVVLNWLWMIDGGIV